MVDAAKVVVNLSPTGDIPNHERSNPAANKTRAGRFDIVLFLAVKTLWGRTPRLSQREQREAKGDAAVAIDALPKNIPVIPVCVRLLSGQFPQFPRGGVKKRG